MHSIVTADTAQGAIEMTLIPVPKPPKSAMNPNRPVSTLLKNQIRHLLEAEFQLPVRLQTNIYVNAIKTEGEAADYIQRVTKALHKAHGVEPRGAGGESPKRKSKGSSKRQSNVKRRPRG